MEHDIRPFDWERLLFGEQPPLYYFEVLLKIVIVFCVLMLVMRMLGKKGQDNLSPMQQMLMIALGSSAGDVMLYPTVALGYAALILFGVTALTVLLEELSNRFRPVRNLSESHPCVLMLDGQVFYERLREQRVNERELFSSIRKAGARSTEQVELAVLEVTGEMSVFLNGRDPPDENLLDYLKREAREAVASGREPPGRPTPGEP